MNRGFFLIVVHTIFVQAHSSSQLKVEFMHVTHLSRYLLI